MTTRRLAGLRLVAVAAALALAGAACSDDDGGGDSGGGTPTTLSGPDAGKALKTVSAGKLTACTDAPNAPFEFEDGGQLDGIDIELVRAVSGRLALQPAFVAVESEALVSALDGGRCDIAASSVPITEESSKSFDFSESYFEITQSLLVRKGDEGALNDLPALSGKTVGVQSGTTGAAFARANAKGATVKEFAGADALFTALEARQVDAALQDLPVNAYNATSTGETVVVKVFAEAEKVQYGLAMKKGSTDLKAAVDSALAEVRSDDTFPTILRRFLGDSAAQS